jgi:hypothetical protein
VIACCRRYYPTLSIRISRRTAKYSKNYEARHEDEWHEDQEELMPYSPSFRPLIPRSSMPTHIQPHVIERVAWVFHCLGKIIVPPAVWGMEVPSEKVAVAS